MNTMVYYFRVFSAYIQLAVNIKSTPMRNMYTTLKHFYVVNVNMHERNRAHNHAGDKSLKSCRTAPWQPLEYRVIRTTEIYKPQQHRNDKYTQRIGQ